MSLFLLVSFFLLIGKPLNVWLVILYVGFSLAILSVLYEQRRKRLYIPRREDLTKKQNYELLHNTNESDALIGTVSYEDCVIGIYRNSPTDIQPERFKAVVLKNRTEGQLDVEDTFSKKASTIIETIADRQKDGGY